MSQRLNLLSNSSGLEGIETSDDHRDGAPGQQGDWDDLSSLLWHAISDTITQNLLFLPGNLDMRTSGFQHKYQTNQGEGRTPVR